MITATRPPQPYYKKTLLMFLNELLNRLDKYLVCQKATKSGHALLPETGKDCAQKGYIIWFPGTRSVSTEADSEMPRVRRASVLRDSKNSNAGLGDPSRRS